MFLPFKPEACFMFFLSTVPRRPFLTDRNSAWREMKIMYPITYNQVINWWSQVKWCRGVYAHVKTTFLQTDLLDVTWTAMLVIKN